MIYTTRSRRFGAGLAILAMLLAACAKSSGSGSAAQQSSVSTLKPLVAPKIESFTADPAQVQDGQSTVLTWTVNDPTAVVRISPLSGSLEGNSVTVTPVLTTTYTLSVTNSIGSDSKSMTIIVGSGGGGGPVATDVPAGAQWVNASTNLTGTVSDCGNLSYMSAYPGRDYVIANVAKQGLFVSADGAAEWLQLGTGPGSAAITNRAQAIIYDPEHPDTFWESGTYGPGVFRTDDAGATFVQLGDIQNVDVLGVDLNDPNRQTLLAGKHEDGLLRLSTDGGNTWTDITRNLPADIGFTHAAVVLDAQTFLLGTTSFGDNPNTGVFRSTDQGQTWNLVSNPGAIGRPLITADGIYWLLEQGFGLIHSTDNGATWTKISSPGPSTIVPSLILLPDGRMATVVGSSVVVSADNGASWRSFGPQLPWDATGLIYAPARNAFYAWHFDCENSGDNPIKEDSIVRLDLGAPSA